MNRQAPAAGEAATSAEDLAACRAAIRAGSKSFHAASLLLPKQLRDGASAVYAFCRLSDDAVDVGDGDLHAVARLRERLDRIYAGSPMDAPADRALAVVAQERGIPRGPLDALLDGMQWDAEGRRYDTLSDLRAYAARVAGSVGAMMTTLMDVRAPDMAARACDLGAAMQLTNIARDVGEDARAGRIYLPLQWLGEAGIEPAAFLADPQPSAAVRGLTKRLLAAAETYYRRSEPGIARLPRSCRPAIWGARYIYAAIGDEIAKNDYDSVTRRAHTSRARKLALLSKAALTATLGKAAARDGLEAAAQDECQFLVDAVADSPRAATPHVWPLDDTVERMLAIAHKLRRLDRGGYAVGEETPPRR